MKKYVTYQVPVMLFMITTQLLNNSLTKNFEESLICGNLCRFVGEEGTFLYKRNPQNGRTVILNIFVSLNVFVSLSH